MSFYTEYSDEYNNKDVITVSNKSEYGNQVFIGISEDYGKCAAGIYLKKETLSALIDHLSLLRDSV